MVAMKSLASSRTVIKPEDEIASFEKVILEDSEMVQDTMRLYELMNYVRWKCQMFEIKYPDERLCILEMKKRLLNKLGDPYWRL